VEQSIIGIKNEEMVQGMVLKRKATQIHFNLL